MADRLTFASYVFRFNVFKQAFSLNLSESEFAQYSDAFFSFDKNNDGTVATKKLGALMRSLGHNPTTAELEDMSELGALMRSLSQNPTKAKLEDMNRKVDAQSKDSIDFQEFMWLMNSIGAFEQA